MDSGQLVRAEIINLDQEGQTIRCIFNPKQYTIKKDNTWKEQDLIGQEIGDIQFVNGKSATLTLEFLFDTYEVHDWIGNTAGQDVRAYTSKLWNLVKINPASKNATTGKGRPPRCQFRWGKLWSFEAVVTDISQTFTMFLPDGTPVRSTVNVTFKQVAVEDAYPAQNPTSGGNPGEHIHAVIAGETLAGIAFDEYGDATVWRHIARTNRITDPRRLRAGQVLLITPLPSG